MSTQPTKPLSVPELQAKVEDLERQMGIIVDALHGVEKAREQLAKEMLFKLGLGRRR